MWALRLLHPAVAGLLLQLGCTVCVSMMSIVAKLAGQLGLPVMEVVLSRSLILLALSTWMLVRQGDQALWPWRSARRWLLLLRGCLGLGAVASLYWAVTLLPLADTAVLAYLAPVMVAATAPLLLGERACRGVLLAMPVCVGGVVLVAQPNFLFGQSAGALSALGVGVAIMHAAFSASAKLTIRALCSTEPVASIIFAMAAVSTIGSAALCVLLPGQLVAPHSVAAWALLVSAGLLGCGVQLLNTSALKLSKAAPAMAMSYLAVVWGLLADLVIFHHRPSPLSLAGAALVCASSLLIIVCELRGSSSSAASSSNRQAEAAGAPPKAKHSSSAEVEAAAYTRLQQQEQEQGCNWLACRGAPPGSRQLELAEGGGRLAGGTAQGGTAQGGTTTAAEELTWDEEGPGAEGHGNEERAPLVGRAGMRQGVDSAEQGGGG